MRVLVTYASRHGSTAEIAERVGQVMRVVLGSAIYLGRWLRPARRFLRAEPARRTPPRVTTGTGPR